MSAPDTNMKSKRPTAQALRCFGVKGAIIFGVVHHRHSRDFILIVMAALNHQPAATRKPTQGITSDSTVPAVTDAEPNGASQS